MAYLTYFLKYVSTYKVLNKIFENDIKDLLGIRVEDPESDDYAFVFSDLIRSILSLEDSTAIIANFDSEGKNKKDFRLGLIHILQEIIKEKIEEHINSTQKNQNIKNIVLEDFDRVSAWTAVLAEGVGQTVEENKVQPHRTIDFRGRLSLPDGKESI
jgi:hypothetical protein